MSTNFGFLQTDWPQLYESAVKAELFALADPGTSCANHFSASLVLLNLKGER